MTIKQLNAPFDLGIARIIKGKGLKQMYVASKAGYSPQEFNDMLNGRKIIKVCDIPRIAKVLGVSSDDIYEMGRKMQGKENESVKEEKEIPL